MHYEFSLVKSRLESSFKPAPPGWEHSNPIGPWCKFCDQEFRFETSAPGDLAASLAAIMDPQVDYHERNSAQIHQLDHRLGAIALGLFIATVVVSLVTLVGLAVDSAWVNAYGNWLTLISAGFPALATAIFGIRFQADFGGDAIRSKSAANALRTIDEELHAGVALPRAADLTEEAARLMLGHLDEWRLINQQRDLSVG